MEKNTHKSLRQMAVINAWFDPVEGQSGKYSLHANVAFQEERLGSEPEANVRFRISLKKCEVVVVLSSDKDLFKADPRTVAMTPPKAPITQERKQAKKVKGGIGGAIGIFGSKPKVDLNVSGEAAFSRDATSADTQVIHVMHTLHGQSKDGFHCWRVSGDYESTLQGSLWNAVEEPRFQLIDKRDERLRRKDIERGMPPVATIEVRCLREDIHIRDIRFKDDQEEKAARRRSGHDIRLKAAESYIRTELLNEGLRVGNLSDMFSEMTVSEMLVPLHD